MSELQVQYIFKFPKKQHEETFEKLRKDGIFQNNV